MTKWCKALLLAVSALLIPVMGMGQTVYATEGGTGDAEPGSEWKISCRPDFGIEDEMQLFYGDRRGISDGDGKWDIFIEGVSGEGNFLELSYPLVISNITAEGEGITDGFLGKDDEEEGAWVLDPKARSDGETDYEAQLSITYGIDAESVTEETLPDGTRVSKEEILGAVQTYIQTYSKTVKVIVSSDVYDLSLSIATGKSIMLQGDSVEVVANVERWYLDENGDDCYQDKFPDAEFIWTAEWEVDETAEKGSIALSGTGNRCTITAPEMECGDYRITYHVEVKVPGKDEPVASAGDEWLDVRKEFYILEPEELAGEADLWVGDSLTVTPKVWHYKMGGIKEEVKGVKYAFSYSSENFEIIDSGGKKVPSGPEDVAAYQNEGTFTIKRLTEGGGDINISAYTLNSGEEGSYNWFVSQ